MWGKAEYIHIDKIQILQNKALKHVFELYLDIILLTYTEILLFQYNQSTEVTYLFFVRMCTPNHSYHTFNAGKSSIIL